MHPGLDNATMACRETPASSGECASSHSSPRRRWTMSARTENLTVRCLIYGHIVTVAFLGWFARNERPGWWSDPEWFDMIVSESLIFCLTAPALTLLCSVFSANESRILRRAYLVEIVLFCVLWIALLPGYQ